MLRHPSSSTALAVGTSHPRSDQIESDNFEELLQQWTDDDGQSSGVVTSTGRQLFVKFCLIRLLKDVRHKLQTTAQQCSGQCLKLIQTLDSIH